MKVAIIGAGLAGLSCAHEFEKNGIAPTIFERKRRIGEDVDYVTSTLQLFDRKHGDPLKYIKDNFEIDLMPLSILKNIEMNAPNKKTIVKGTRGYIFCRGEAGHSIENQVASYVKSPITFYKHVYIDDIRKDYDYVINATGSYDYAKQRGIFTPHYQAFVRIAVISGSFDKNTIKMWVNNEYSKQSFSYMLPHSPNKACLTVVADNITHTELDYYWEKYVNLENLQNTIVKTRDAIHETGIVYPPKIDNEYFAGTSGGFLGSVLGFGMVNAITTGAFSARSIIYKQDYEKLVKPIRKFLFKKYELRKVINTFDNNDFDKLVEFLGLPVVKQIIYKNPLARAHHASFAAKVYNKLKNNN